jgi:hypothetical protein
MAEPTTSTGMGTCIWDSWHLTISVVLPAGWWSIRWDTGRSVIIRWDESGVAVTIRLLSLFFAVNYLISIAQEVKQTKVDNVVTSSCSWVLLFRGILGLRIVLISSRDYGYLIELKKYDFSRELSVRSCQVIKLFYTTQWKFTCFVVRHLRLAPPSPQYSSIQGLCSTIAAGGDQSFQHSPLRLC